MKTVLRFSAAVAFSHDRRQRWRQVCLLAASFIATFAVLVALGLIALAYSSPLRAGAVLGVPTAAVGDEYPGMSPEGAVAAAVDRGTLAMGRQVPTVWIEPMAGHEDDPAAVPQVWMASQVRERRFCRPRWSRPDTPRKTSGGSVPLSVPGRTG